MPPMMPSATRSRTGAVRQRRVDPRRRAARTSPRSGPSARRQREQRPEHAAHDAGEDQHAEHRVRERLVEPLGQRVARPSRCRVTLAATAVGPRLERLIVGEAERRVRLAGASARRRRSAVQPIDGLAAARDDRHHRAAESPATAPRRRASGRAAARGRPCSARRRPARRRRAARRPAPGCASGCRRRRRPPRRRACGTALRRPARSRQMRRFGRRQAEPVEAGQIDDLGLDRRGAVGRASRARCAPRWWCRESWRSWRARRTGG